MIRFYARLVAMLLIGAAVFLPAFLLYKTWQGPEFISFELFGCVCNIPPLDGLLSWLLLLAFGIFTAIVIFCEWHEKFFAAVHILAEEIRWRCIFRKTRTMKLSQCRFIGAELEESYWQLDYPFVYFSIVPYPREIEYKINKLKNSDKFIKFWYTDKLAEYLMEHIPKEKTGGVQYYCRQQNRSKKKR